MIVYLPIETSTVMKVIHGADWSDKVRGFDPRFYLHSIFIYGLVIDPKSAVRSKADDPDESRRSYFD